MRSSWLFLALVGCSESAANAPVADASVEDTAVVDSEADAALPACAPNPTPPGARFAVPPITGAYGVGRSSRTLVDPARDEPVTPDTADKRKILLDLYYPTERCTKAGEPALYLEDEIAALYRAPATTDAGVDEAGTDTGVTDSGSTEAAVPDDWNRRVATYVRTGVPFIADGKKHPVLLFSPGYGGHARHYTFMIEELVSRGWVVAAMTHTYDTPLVVFPDGTKAPGEPLNADLVYLGKHIDVWKLDAKFVLNTLEKLNTDDSEKVVTGRLDLEHVGMFGHSYGGATSLLMAYEDPRIDAAADLDGLPFGEGVATGLAVKKPFMFVTVALSDKTIDATMNKLNPGYKVRIAQITHGSFSDVPLFWKLVGQKPPVSYGKADPQRVLHVTWAYLDALFKQHVLGTTEPLLDGPSADYPEVTFTKKP